VSAASDPLLPYPVPEYLGLSFPAPPADRPYVILNMVSSADGKAASAGTEASLSSPVDKLVLQSLRVHADAILNGAATARATGVNPGIRDARLQQRRQDTGRSDPPLQCILSASASLAADAPFLRRKDFRLVIFVSEAAPAERIAALRASGSEVEILPAGPEGLHELVRRLRHTYGIRLLLLEGGPTLNSSFFHEDLVDEFFLTLGPHIVGGRDAPTTVEGDSFEPRRMPQLELLSAFPSQSTSEVYLHWRIRHHG
jgi:2,5-diamino-6-(ribosylamino)-4(3H)-pyrimidinone 5'-phosphate reductase